MKKANRTHTHGIVTSFGRSPVAVDAVRGCLDDMRQHCDAPPTLVLLFGGGKLEPEVLLETLNQTLPGVPVIGGSAAGVIATSALGCTGLEVGMVAFFDPAVTPKVHATYELLERDYEAGRQLGMSARGTHAPASAVLLFYDSVRAFQPRQLHLAGSVLDGFRSGWQREALVIGGGLLTDLNLSDGWMLLDGSVRRHAAAALVFPPGVSISTEVLHACRPVSAYMTITRIEGAEVFELDGDPALDVIEERIGQPLVDSAGHPTRILTLGEKLDDPWEVGSPEDYVNRLILTGNRSVGSVTLFEPDFSEGTMVQLMQNDSQIMLDSARDGALAAMQATAEGTDPFLRLYIDCAGRASMMSGTETEEAKVVTETLSDGVPFLGFYSGVEIAPVRGISRPLDWTGVLATLRVQRS